MEQSNSSENKRIAKNTMVLYVRMIVMMIISFFTARITLNALGVTDYGINNVVGGLVSMFSLISSSLSASTSRFLTFGLGEGDNEKLKKIFSTSVNIHIILAIIVVLAVESIGVWFLNNKMNIPPERMEAANWVLQCSVVVFAISLFSVPYNSAIIAHEKMTAFAYMTIFDAATRLIIIGGVYFYQGDKLILFALMLMGQTFLRQSIYWIYCRRKFEECTYHWTIDKDLTKSMFSFAGWSFIGCTAVLLKDQGVNVAINLFAGPAINAARGIAIQVNSIMGQFTGGFLAAVSPQITKNYASGNLNRVYDLIFYGSRFSYYLFLFLSIPVLFEIEKVLQIWLGQVPDHTVLFTRLIIVMTLLEFPTYYLITAQSATGKIKNYQIVVGGILMLNLPVSYLLLKMGAFPESTLIACIVIEQLCQVARICFLYRQIQFPVMTFIKKVYLNLLFVTLISLSLPFICYHYMDATWLRLFIVVALALISSAFSIYYVGLSAAERVKMRTYIYKYMYNIIRK